MTTKRKKDSPKELSAFELADRIESVSQGIGWLISQDQNLVNKAYQKLGIDRLGVTTLEQTKDLIRTIHQFQVDPSMIPPEEVAPAVVDHVDHVDPVTETTETPATIEAPAEVVTPKPAEAALNTAVAATVAASVPQYTDRQIQQMLDWKASILQANEAVSAALAEYENLKSRASSAKKVWEEAVAHLQLIIEDQPGSAPLFDGLLGDPQPRAAAAESPVSTTSAEYAVDTHKEWDAEWQKFLDQNLDVLEISDTVKEKIHQHYEGDKPLRTLGDLTKIKEVYPHKGYTAIKGIGEGKATQIDDAYTRLLEEWLFDHPQPKPGAVAESEGEVEACPWDFVNTFPKPLNLEGYSEKDDLEYQNDFINDLTAEVKERINVQCQISDANGEFGEGPSSDLTQSLTEITDRISRSYETYREIYGEQAEAAIREKIEGPASNPGAESEATDDQDGDGASEESKPPLKGGLE